MRRQLAALCRCLAVWLDPATRNGTLLIGTSSGVSIPFPLDVCPSLGLAVRKLPPPSWNDPAMWWPEGFTTSGASDITLPGSPPKTTASPHSSEADKPVKPADDEEKPQL